MTHNEHELVLLMEECGEASLEAALARVVIRASKLLRFGGDDKEPGHELPNSLRLRYELNDVLFCIRMLERSGQIPVATDADIAAHGEAKRAKVERMIELSRRRGRLHPPMIYDPEHPENNVRYVAIDPDYKVGSIREQPPASGWRVVVDEKSDGVWLKLFGPEGQGAAFNVASNSVRAEVLRQYAAASGPAKPGDAQ